MKLNITRRPVQLGAVSAIHPIPVLAWMRTNEMTIVNPHTSISHTLTAQRLTHIMVLGHIPILVSELTAVRYRTIIDDMFFFLDLLLQNLYLQLYGTTYSSERSEFSFRLSC